MGRRAIVFIIVVALAAHASAWGSSTDRELERGIERALARVAGADRDPLILVPPAPPKEDIGDERRTFSIARSIRTVETQLDTTLAVLNGDVLPLLSLARNYRHLGMRGRALEWYERAQLADSPGDYARAIWVEISQCVIELADSSRSVQSIEQLLTEPHAARYGEALGMLLASLSDLAVGPEILRLARRTEELDDLPASTRLVLADLWLRVGEAGAARNHYVGLLRGQRKLDLETCAWALRGLADATLAAGKRAEAARLYRQYQGSDAGSLSAWSTYQLGSLAAAAGDFDAAVTSFRSICERQDETPWREEACTRLAQARQLLEIEAALRPYGRSLGKR